MKNVPAPARSGRDQTGGARRWRARGLTVAVVVVIAACAVLHLLNLTPVLTWGGDSAMYIMHAMNIVGGHPYNATPYIQNPGNFLGPSAYPPGFPLLLAPAYAVFGLNIQALNGFVLCVFILTLAVMAWYFRDPFTAPYGGLYLLALIALVGFNPQIVELAMRPLSDVPFLLFLVLALAALQRAYAQHEHARTDWVGCLVAGACIYLVMSTRIVGVVLLPAVVVFDLTRYRRLTAVSLVGIPVCLALLGAQTLLLELTNTTMSGAPTGYARMMQADAPNRPLNLISQCLQHAYAYVEALHAYWIRDRSNVWITPFVIGTLALASGGWCYRVATRYTILEPFVVLYVLALLPWSVIYPRYLLPVVPAYFFYMLIGLSQLHRLLQLRYPVLLVAILLVACIPYWSRYNQINNERARIRSQAPNSPAAFALYRYIDTHTKADAVIIFRKPRILALFTNRDASTFAYRNQPTPARDQEQLRYFKRIGARYALAGPPDFRHVMDGLARRHPDIFTQIYASDSFRLYRYDPAISR